MGILLAPLEMLPLKQSKNILPNKAKAFCLHSSPRLKTCGFSANEVIKPLKLKRKCFLGTRDGWLHRDQDLF